MCLAVLAALQSAVCRYSRTARHLNMGERVWGESGVHMIQPTDTVYLFLGGLQRYTATHVHVRTPTVLSVLSRQYTAAQPTIDMDGQNTEVGPSLLYSLLSTVYSHVTAHRSHTVAAMPAWWTGDTVDWTLETTCARHAEVQYPRVVRTVDRCRRVGAGDGARI